MQEKLSLTSALALIQYRSDDSLSTTTEMQESLNHKYKLLEEDRRPNVVYSKVPNAKVGHARMKEDLHWTYCYGIHIVSRELIY